MKLMTRDVLRLLVLTVVAVVICGSLHAADRPNILFIMTDDQGVWTTGHSGNMDAFTPNMNRLRREGASLVNSFVVTPVCSPSRGELMSSRYSSELKINDWIMPSETHGLSRDLAVWPKLLQQAGYQTGLIGKWHCGHTPEFHPTHFGYGEFMGLLTGGCATKGPTLEKNDKPQKFEGLAEDIFTDESLDFIRRHQQGPFALSLHYRAPHTAYLPVSDDDWSHFAGKTPGIPNVEGLDRQKTEKNMREYLASVSCVDRNLGRILGLLDELKLTDKTLVIFTSDHGYNIGHHGLHHKGNATWLLKDPPPSPYPNIPRNRRPNMFDTSLRLPTVARWPGVIKPGSTIAQTVTNLDWFPTLCEVGSATVPEQTVLRGRSIAPLLRGESPAWDNDFYGEYNMRNGAKTQMRVYRTTEWKLMRDFANPGRAELYHLAKDPGETTNLIDSDRADARAALNMLDEKIAAMMRKLGDAPEVPLSKSAQ